MRHTILVLTVIIGMAAGAWADPIVTFSLTPADGAISGATGDSVGWGYTISTDSDYIFIESISFNESTPIGFFDCISSVLVTLSCTSLGVPSSYASAGSPLIVPWVLDTLGLQYVITSNVLGAASLGTMTLTYDSCTDSSQSDCVFGNTVNAQLLGSDVVASVIVNSVPEPPASIPEPTALSSLGMGLGLLFWRYRR